MVQHKAKAQSHLGGNGKPFRRSDATSDKNRGRFCIAIHVSSGIQANRILQATRIQLYCMLWAFEINPRNRMYFDVFIYL